MSESDARSKLDALRIRRHDFDSLISNIAILDAEGTILEVNAAWQEFARTNGLEDPIFGVGSNYFRASRSALDPSARSALNGIRDVLSGRRSTYFQRYPCHGPTEDRWFVLRAAPIENHSNFLLVAHQDVTSQITLDPTILDRDLRLEDVRFGSAFTDSPDYAALDHPLPDNRTVLLLVDDEEPIRNLLTSYFEANGMCVHAASDGDQALRLLELGIEPDCILTDYLMPNMNGFDLLQRAREMIKNDVPCFIMSGYASEEAVSTAEKANYVWVQKPFEMDRLLAVINSSIRQASDTQLDF